MKYTLTRQQVARIGDLLDLDAAAVRRSMYGVAFVVPETEIVRLGVAVAAVLVDDAPPHDSDHVTALATALEMTRGALIDSAGPDPIVYFPNITAA